MLKLLCWATRLTVGSGRLLSISVSAAQLAQSHRLPYTSLLPLSDIAIHMGFGSPQPNCESCIFDELFAMQFAGQVKFFESFSVWGCLELPVTDINKSVGQTKSGKTAKTFGNPKWKLFDLAGFASLPSLPAELLLLFSGCSKLDSIGNLFIFKSAQRPFLIN